MLNSNCGTCRLGLHVSRKFAADTVVIGANVMKTPSSELLSTMELQTKTLIMEFAYAPSHFFCTCALLDAKKVINKLS